MALTQHWKLDDNAANTTVLATVGADGTLLGGDNTSAKRTAGPGGSIPFGFDLNGTDDAVSIVGLTVVPNSAFSANAFANFDGAGGPILGRDANDFTFIYKTNDTTITVSIGNSGFVSFTVPSLGTGRWNHVLVTRAATTNATRVFVNGVESSSGAQTVSNGSNTAFVRIGRRNTLFLDGKVAQVKLFNSDESANAAALYAEGLGGGHRKPHLAIGVGV